jgi:hypothetical protein
MESYQQPPDSGWGRFSTSYRDAVLDTACNPNSQMDETERSRVIEASGISSEERDDIIRDPRSLVARVALKGSSES